MTPGWRILVRFGSCIPSTEGRCLRNSTNFTFSPLRNSSNSSESVKRRVFPPNDGLTLKDFVSQSPKVKPQRLKAIIPSLEETAAYLSDQDLSGQGRTVNYVTYGCQMNVSDMDIVRSVMESHGYEESHIREKADVVMLMTCAIREGAEKKVFNELKKIRSVATNRSQIVAVLGCMAERVRHDLLEKRNLVKIVAGPDSYRDLPRLLAVARAGSDAINVQLSYDETYADITPVRVDPNSKTAFVSIMRGCDNMCTFCIVPFTRGRERSRPLESIVEEVKQLRDEGVRQITLLGQNVNSYRDTSVSTSTVEPLVQTPFKTVYKPKMGGRTFVTLLEKVSEVAPEVRFRFTSPHPKDFPTALVELIRSKVNLCKQLHLPAQSGDDATLERMGRGYTRDIYLRLVDDVRSILPSVSLTSDFIAGFCGETEEAHQQTVDLIRQVKYSFCFAFPYSMRPKTRAHHRLSDDVPEDVKSRRHIELVKEFREGAEKINNQLIGTQQVVLIEGTSKRNALDVVGRTDGGTTTIVPNNDSYQPGDYVLVDVVSATSQSLRAVPITRTSLH